MGSRRWPWWLHPLRERRRLYQRIDELNAVIIAQADEMGGQRARLAAQQQELRLAAGTAGWSVGWEQAGGVTPEFVIVGTSRGREPGVRVYASREMAGSAIRLIAADGGNGKWKLEAVLGRALVSNEADRRAAIEHIQAIWDNWERLERETADEAVTFLDGGSHRTTGDG